MLKKICLQILVFSFFHFGFILNMDDPNIDTKKSEFVEQYKKLDLNDQQMISSLVQSVKVDFQGLEALVNANQLDRKIDYYILTFRLEELNKYIRLQDIDESEVELFLLRSNKYLNSKKAIIKPFEIHKEKIMNTFRIFLKSIHDVDEKGLLLVRENLIKNKQLENKQQIGDDVFSLGLHNTKEMLSNLCTINLGVTTQFQQFISTYCDRQTRKKGRGK